MWGRRALWLVPGLMLGATGASVDFTQSIRPVLAENCGTCHNPSKPRNPANFLKAQTAKDIEADRGLWHNVASQLRNRTMPPVASKLSEDDRLRVATWIDTQLRQTACSGGDYAGAATLRRLNRREYHNTIRDLLGVDFDVSLIFPADGTGGSGFDTNGETLYVPPVLMERYMTAAQQILDRVIITPPLAKAFVPGPVAAGAEYAMKIPVYLDGDYTVVASQEGTETPAKLILKVDGVVAGNLQGRNNFGGPATRKSALTKATLARNLARIQLRLTRGDHMLTIGAGDVAAKITTVDVAQIPETPTPEKRALHYRLLGTEPSEAPMQPRKAARQVLASFLPRAFRRPVEASEIDQFMMLFDRAAQRGDPYTESIKLALRGVLLWPDFLFHLEKRNTAPGLHPIGQYEMAARLSYFMWSTIPDDQLTRLADQGRLQDPAVLKAQVERMLDDPRARTFVDTFVGQWLGTQDVGGRVVPMLTELLAYYNPDTAADLRAEPVLLFDHILGENRSLLELLTADYTFLTERLVKFYQLEGKVDVHGNEFQMVKWPDNRRAGVTGMGSVLAMTSHYEQTSPVLRGAWALETLLGTPVPPPPPDVPPLDPARSDSPWRISTGWAGGARRSRTDCRSIPRVSYRRERSLMDR
jgi:cytochrome c553